MVIVILLLSIHCIFSGCSNRAQIDYTLADAEKLLYEQPDSALAMLNEVVEYYSKVKDYNSLFRSYYLLGRMYYNKVDYPNAMLAFVKAEEFIEHVDDNFTIGKLYAHKGFINRVICDYSQSVAAYFNACSYYSKTDSVSYQIAAGINIGRTYIDMQSYELGEQFIKEYAKQAYLIGNLSLCKSAIHVLEEVYVLKDEREKVAQLQSEDYCRACSDIAFDDILLYKDVLSQSMVLSNGEPYGRWSAYAMQRDSTLIYLKDYYINKGINDYIFMTYVYRNPEDLYKYNSLGTTSRSTLQQPVTAALKEHFEAQAELKALELKYNRRLQIGLVILALLIISIILLVSRQIISLKNARINRYMDIAQNLESTLFEHKRMLANKTEEADSFKQEADSMKQKTDTMKQKVVCMKQETDTMKQKVVCMQHEADNMKLEITSLFEKQFDMLDKLCTTYYESREIKKEKEFLYMLIKAEINKLSNDRKSIAQLEEIVNRYKGNIMKITREALPQLLETDYRLLCLIYAGFSAKAISVFTSNTVASIYNKKARLKEKIAHMDIKEKEALLNNLQ